LYADDWGDVDVERGMGSGARLRASEGQRRSELAVVVWFERRGRKVERDAWEGERERD
jgi:hypothetical protein